MSLESFYAQYAPQLTLGLYVVLGVVLVVLVVLLRRQGAADDLDATVSRALEASLAQRDEQTRDYVSREMGALRQELGQAMRQQASDQNGQFVNFLGVIQQLSLDQTTQMTHLRESVAERLQTQAQHQQQTTDALRDAMVGQLQSVGQTVGRELERIRAENDKAMTDIRQTVQDKLQETLNERLTTSFKTVEDQLAAVHRGLGEMREMAQNVDGLRRVLGNVKTRGTFGEVQLGYLLDEMLTPEQYATNVATRPNSTARVEFAVRLPGNGLVEQVWLPIDAKFPMEDFERLMDARERADKDAEQAAVKALATRIVDEAAKIRAKYVEAPYTTEFAILYLPVESLWAEVLKIPGLMARIQRESHVTIAGPTVLAALVNSLQMGFRTLAIEQKSAEVWHVLGVVKSEFLKFVAAIDGVEKKVESVRSELGKVRTRTNVMQRRLQDVEAVDLSLGEAPSGDASELERLS